MDIFCSRSFNEKSIPKTSFLSCKRKEVIRREEKRLEEKRLLEKRLEEKRL